MVSKNNLSLFHPCIDLHEGKVKQIVGSSLSEGADPTVNFASDKGIEYFVDHYKSNDLIGGHIIMLDDKSEDACLLAVKRCPNTFSVGGGLDLEKGRKWLDNGARKVIFTSYLFEKSRLSRKRLLSLENAFDKDEVVVDLSCKKIDSRYVVMANKWQEETDLELSFENLSLFSASCNEVLIHAINREGKGAGVDLGLVSLMAEWSKDTGLHFTYAGGVSSYEDVRSILSVGQRKVSFTVGSGLDLFGGHLKLSNIIPMMMP